MEKKQEGSKLKKFFKNIDFFSITFQFRVANKEKYSSFFGGVSSLFYIVITLAYMLKSFFDFISWADKKIQFITRYDSREYMNITNKNFFYSFKFTYAEGFYDPENPEKKEEEKNVVGSKYWDMFEIENNYVIIDLGSKEKTKLGIKECTNDLVNITDFQDLKFDPDNPDNDEEQLDIHDHICFDYKNLSLFGQYTDNQMAYIEISLKIKQEYYEDLEKLKWILENVLFKFAFYYSDHIYDVSKIIQPVSKRVESTIYSYVDYGYYERVNIFLEKLEYSLDDYPLYKKPKVTNYLKFSSYEKSMSPLINRLTKDSTFSNRYNFVKYFIRPDMKRTIINVTLMKLPEFLSGTSAISTNLLIIFSIIISFLNRFQAKQKIVTKIMKFNDVLKVNNRQEIDYLSAKLKERDESIDRSSSNNFRKNNLGLNQFKKSYLNETSIILEEKSKIESDEFLAKNKNLDNSISNIGCSDRSAEKLNDIPVKFNCGNIIENQNYSKNNTIELHTVKNLGENTINLVQESLQNRKVIEVSAVAKAKNQVEFDPRSESGHKDSVDLQNHSNSKNNKYVKTDGSGIRGRKLSNHLKITTCELISNYICCRNIKDKKTIFTIAEEKFNNNIDILTYQRKMLEIDILKYLILDKDLVEIMNFISKPTVSFKSKNNRHDEEMAEFFHSHLLNKNNLCMFKIKDSYDKIVEDESRKNAHVKERILKLFSSQIKELAEI